MTIDVGARLGPYEIVSLLGSGGMGHVYRARDTELARFVAIKVLKETPTSSAKALSRLEREARLASSLNHPNIVTVYGIGRSEGMPYIAMRLIKGKTLSELIALERCFQSGSGGHPPGDPLQHLVRYDE